MKRIVALLLVCCMLVGYTTAIAESILDSAFVKGAEALLSSIDLVRDMLTLNIDYLGSSVFSAKLKGRENMIDLSATVEESDLQTQISDTDISVRVDEKAFNLQYDDVEALLTALSEDAAPDMEIYKEISTLLINKVIMPDVVLDYSDGTHITYSSDEKQLLAHLSEFFDAVLADERYSAGVEQVIQLISALSGEELPPLVLLKEQLEEEWKRLETEAPNFVIAFELIADKAFTKMDVTGEIDTSYVKYAMNWTYRQETDSYKLDGLLWETRTVGEKTRKYEITVKGDFRGDSESNLWSFSITHPSVGFNVEASGAMEGNMGSFCLYYNHLYNPSNGFQIQLDYALEEDGIIATALITPGRMGNYIATLVAGKKQFSLTIKNYSGRKLFLLNLFADDNRTLKYGYLEYQQSLFTSPYNPRLSDTDKVTAEYDGEKLVITSNGVTVTCTGAFESDHAYVITLHAEGEHVQPGQDKAYIRFEYEGKEGDFFLSCRVIGPDDQEALAVKLTCTPTEGITELLREKEGVIRLGPDTLQTLIMQ